MGGLNSRARVSLVSYKIILSFSLAFFNFQNSVDCVMVM